MDITNDMKTFLSVLWLFFRIGIVLLAFAMFGGFVIAWIRHVDPSTRDTISILSGLWLFRRPVSAERPVRTMKSHLPAKAGVSKNSQLSAI